MTVDWQGNFPLGDGGEKESSNIISSSLNSDAVFENEPEILSSCFYFSSLCFAGWILFVLTTWCGLVCSDGWSASREEIQQCLVWRYEGQTTRKKCYIQVICSVDLRNDEENDKQYKKAYWI